MKVRSDVPRTERGYLHVEAFCLMWYACPCGHRERIWNSRDGVTPFGALCPSCGQPEMKHVDWGRDQYAPHHVPAEGQRQWVAMTREAAARIADVSIARQAARGHTVPTEYRSELIESIFHNGEAPALVVTGYTEVDA